MTSASMIGRPDRQAPAGVRPGYGRARLYLGISGVGSVVVLSVVALAVDLPGAAGGLLPATFAGQVLTLALFVVVYAAVHAPFDVFGGYLLPRWYGRPHPTATRFVRGLCRGAAVHGLVLLTSGVMLLVGGWWLGVPGAIAAGLATSLMLLAARLPLARAMASLRIRPAPPEAVAAGVPSAMVDCDDEGFTGGFEGVTRARRSLLPGRWLSVLGSDGLRLSARRRSIGAGDVAWRRGRIAAVAFTWLGLAASAVLVGPEAIGTAGGVIELGLWFTLWSFVGLLVLPTASRRGVAAVDARVRDGDDAGGLDEAIRRLDGLQDGEASRPSVVEAVFHPIPSVRNRADGAELGRGLIPGCWDAARTAVYLGASGMGLLGRAVHCNCGRPALWVFLPMD